MPELKLSPEERRRLVLRALSGEKREALAREYDITLQHVYKVIRQDTEPADLAYRRALLAALDSGDAQDQQHQ